MTSVLLGLKDEPIPPQCTGSWDTTKIGSKLCWIHPTPLEHPKCQDCSRVQLFISQVYCPLTHSPYHRVLYIFACRNKACFNKSTSWSVLRCQLIDLRYTDTSQPGVKQTTASLEDWGTDANDWGEEPKTKDTHVPITMKTDDWCIDADDWGDAGSCNDDLVATVTNKGPSYSDIVKKTAVSERTMSRDEVADEVENAEAKMRTMCVEDMDDTSESSASKNDAGVDEASHVQMEDIDFSPSESVLSKMLNIKDIEASENEGEGKALRDTDLVEVCGFYVSVIEEPSGGGKGCLKYEEKLLSEYSVREGVDVKKLGDFYSESKGGKHGGVEGYEKAVAKHGDRMFQKFIKRVSVCPQQILRYEYGGCPLHLTAPSTHPVPPCTYCGQPRVFELQFMPTLVSLLKIQQQEEAAVEFGTALVYTCSKSCWSDTDPYRTEHVIVEADPDQQYFR